MLHDPEQYARDCDAHVDLVLLHPFLCMLYYRNRFQSKPSPDPPTTWQIAYLHTRVPRWHHFVLDAMVDLHDDEDSNAAVFRFVVAALQNDELAPALYAVAIAERSDMVRALLADHPCNKSSEA